MLMVTLWHDATGGAGKLPEKGGSNKLERMHGSWAAFSVEQLRYGIVAVSRHVLLLSSWKT